MLYIVAIFSQLAVIQTPAIAPAKGEPSGSLRTTQRAADTTFVSLDELVRTALANNLTLRAAAAEMRGAESYTRATRSRYDPVLNVGGDTYAEGIGGQVVGQLPTGASYLLGSVAPSTLPGQPLYQNALVVSMSQPLLRGMGWQSDRYSVRAVDEGVAAVRARLERTRHEVTASIGISYSVLVQRHRQEAIAERSVKRAEELRTAYTDLHALGKITEVDLITARLGVASRRASLLQFRRDRREAEDGLLFAVYGARTASVLAAGERVLMPRDTSLMLPAMVSLDSATAIALSARTDIEAARHEAARAKYQSQYARNAWLPTLDLSGSMTHVQSRQPVGVLAPATDSKAQQWSFGFVFSRPLRNAGASAERVRALAAESRAEVAVTDAENVVRAEVRTAFRNIELGREQLALASEASQLARRQYDGERERLNLGLTEIFRVLQYEEQVARVERAEADAWLELAASAAQYRLAIGAS